jgi:hypothetical protein
VVGGMGVSLMLPESRIWVMVFFIGGRDVYPAVLVHAFGKPPAPSSVSSARGKKQT